MIIEAIATSDATVQVALTTDGSPVTKLMRSDSNGVHEVRTLIDSFPTVAVGTTVVVDHEAAHGEVTYIAYIGTQEYYGKVTVDLGTPWLTMPILPQHSERVSTITEFSHSRPASSTFHQIIGRPDPVATIGEIMYRRGSFDVFCHSYAEARKLELVFQRGEVVMLRQTVAGMDMYFVTEGIDVQPYEPDGVNTRFRFSVSYIEVSRPEGYLLGAIGWDYDSLATDYASYDALLMAFNSYDKLTLGQVA